MSYTPPPDLLKDRVILVTGAGDGIGRATALAAAAHGATVVLLGRTVTKLKAVYDAIEQAGGAQPAIYPIDFEGATAHDFAVMGERLDQAFRTPEKESIVFLGDSLVFGSNLVARGEARWFDQVHCWLADCETIVEDFGASR